MAATGEIRVRLRGGSHDRRHTVRALGFDLIDVRRLERILVLVLEHEAQPAPLLDERVQPLPPGRFVRPGNAFDHRFLATTIVEVEP
jgi:hypothetical protein